MPWIIGLLLLAAAAHEATIALLPRVMMWGLTRRLDRLGGTGRILHAPRADERQRQVVMPSPDLLYSYCLYDLAQGPLRVHAEIPADALWSLSAYDASTDNFFTIDDRDAGGGSVDLVLTPDGRADPAFAPGIRVLRSPSRRGILLFRTLVDQDARMAALDAARRRASCEVLTPASPR